MDIAAVGMGALGVTPVAIMTTIVFGGRELRRWWLGKRWTRARERHELAVIEHAMAIDEVVEDLAVLHRRVHYRHAIHCPTCGRFARQAEGYPSGIAHCALHGLGTRTPPATGAIAVIVTEVHASLGVAFPEPPPVALPAEAREYVALDTAPIPVVVL